LITTGYESFQLVAFFAGFPPASDAAKLWAKHFPEPYATFNKPNPAVSVASGAWAGSVYELHLHPTRVDLVAKPENTQSGPPPSVKDLQSFASAALGVFLPIVADLTIERIATIVTYREGVKDMAGAVKRISTLLPTLPVQSDDSDINFQVSRPKITETQDDLKKNLLTRWSTGVVVEMVVQIGPSGIPVQMPGTQHAFMEQVFDYNTSPENRPRKDLIPDLFDELIQDVQRMTGSGISQDA